MPLSYKKADPLVHGAVKNLTCITEADKQPHHEEIYYGFGYNGVGVSAAPWTGKQLSKLVFSSNSKELDISKIYKGLPKKFVFPQLRTFYFRLAVWFYAIKDKINI